MVDTVGFVPLPKSSADDTNTEPPVLVLDSFAPRTIVDFGDVKAGKTKIKCFTIENPHPEEVTVTTVKFPATKTIVLHGYSAEESKTRVYKVPPQSCVDVRISWTPQSTNGHGKGMRQNIELEWERKRLVVMLIGFAVETKQNKKIVKRIHRPKPEKPLDLSMGRDENDVNLRFKGVVNHTAKGDKSAVPALRSGRVLGENQKSNIKPGGKPDSLKRKITKHNRPSVLDLKSPSETENVRVDDELLPTPLRTEFADESPFAFVDTPDEEPSHHTAAPKVTPPASSVGDNNSPFQEALTPLTPTPHPAAFQTPRSRKRWSMRSELRECKRHKRKELFSMFTDECAEIVPNLPPTPVQALVKQDCMSSNSSGSGEGSASTGKSRKRRTWGAPDVNPLFKTPTVMTRGMMKRIGEESSCQQTFMECHTMGGSVLERGSPPRNRECDTPLSPAPFVPPNDTVVENKPDPGSPLPVPTFQISPEDNGRVSGPLTATPLHPSMVLKMEKKDDNLPCFDTSIIPHISPNANKVNKAEPSQENRKSEAFVVPAIETTSSTVNLSQEEIVASTPLVKPAEKGSSEKSSAESRKKPGVIKPALRSQSKAKTTKTGPVIKSSASTRPKTAPGLARREGLKKTVPIETARLVRHPAKRRSLSAPRVESTPKSSIDMNVKPAKRKDLVTPTMGPPRSPGKRPRPLNRVVIVDESFREKRHRSCDVAAPKTPGTRLSRRSVAPPTGTRVKMHNSRLSGALPRHPLALSTAKNIYFDEKWKAKQERGFTIWMNFYLVPPQGTIPPQYQNTRDIMKNAARKARKSVAPPDNAKILAKLQAERKLLQAERKASAMFQSTKMVEVLLKLEKEINEGGLTIRGDRKLDADLGLKDQLIDLMLCYNPVWLRLGLEVLYEEILPLSEHRDLAGLVTFLNCRFVNNPVIAQQYAHPTVPGSYGAGYEQELRRFTLKKFLMLVLLLDVAKTARVVDCDPCLFCLKSPHKTSRSILISFSNTFLSGEGDITKHLGYIGYTVKHEQRHIDEFDYIVKRIESELRDGVRLTRLVEIITETSLLDKLRTPAVSRLQKLHNVGVSLTQLQDEGVKLDNVPGGPIVSKSVVDGNQNLTLALIWKIIFQYSITKILAMDQLKAEVHILKEILSRKKQANMSPEDQDDDFVLGLPGRRLSVDERGFFNSEVLATLLDWCKIVCSYYDVPVDNFTVSFSDGRVLCLLVHHYHPELLPLSRIKMQTSLSHQLMELNASRDFLSDSLLDPELHRENEKENFRALCDAMKGLNNVPYMITPGDMIGTIPDEKVVITFVSYLCAALVDISQDFRAAQKIQRAWRRRKFLERHEAMRETRRAVIRVQALARALLARRELEKMKLNREAIIAARREYAAKKIQVNWRKHLATRDVRKEFLQKREAAKTIQKFYKAILEERWRDRICAAKLIQKTWRGNRERKRYLKFQISAVKIQSAFRMSRSRQNYLKLKSAASVISTIWRGHVTMKKVREDFLIQRSAAVCIQRHLRGFLARERTERIRAAIKLQSLCRGYLARVEFQRMKSQKELIEKQIRSSIMLQSTIRGFLVRRDLKRKARAATKIQEYFRSHLITRQEREKFLLIKQKILIIQSRYRGYLVRKEISSQQEAATKIQSIFRGYLVRRHIQQQQQSAGLIQQTFRGYLLMRTDRDSFLQKRAAAIKIQSSFRMITVLKMIATKNNAAALIQSTWRMYAERSRYNLLKESAVRIQRSWRSAKTREQIRDQKIRVLRSVLLIQSQYRGAALRAALAEQHRCVVKIQAAYRGHVTRKEISLKHNCAALIQACYRGHQETVALRSRFLNMRSSAVVIQSHIRSYLVRREIARSVQAAVCIQVHYRGYCARKSYLKQRSAVCLLQEYTRAWLTGRKQRNRYLELRRAAILIQACIRGTQTRRQIHKQNLCSTKIQATWRMYATRSRYLEQKRAIVKLQSAWRRYSQVRKYRNLREKAVKIQAWYRMHRQVQIYKYQIQSCIKVQSLWRGYVTRKCYLKIRDAVIKIQAAARGRNARRVGSCLKSLSDLRKRLLDQELSLSQVAELNRKLSEMVGS